MWQWGHILDGFHFQAGGFQSGDRTFATAAGAFDLHFDILDAKLLGLFSSLLSGTLTGKRGALAATLETARASARPTQRVTLGVGDCHGGVVEGRLDVSDHDRHVSTDRFLLDFRWFNLLGHCKPYSKNRFVDLLIQIQTSD
jgi:hypothetical protein